MESIESELPPGELAFRWLGGHRVLDFTATVGQRWRSGFERLRVPADLARWLAEAGLVEVAPQVNESQLSGARLLREALYGAATMVRTGRFPFSADLEEVNRRAERSRPGPQLRLVGSELTAVRRLTDVEACLDQLAREGVELLGGPLKERVRECAGSECALLFLDDSRNSARRWCSMDDCGARSKMSAYRTRRARAAR